MYAIVFWRFPIRYFFEYCSEWFFSLPSSSPCNSFFMLLIHSAFPLCSFCSTLAFFTSLISGCLFLLEHFSPTSLSSFSNVLFCCLTLSLYYLYLFSFAKIFWFMSSSCIVRLFCCFVSVFYHNISSCSFPSWALSLVVTVSLPVLLVLFPIQVCISLQALLRNYDFITD